MFAETYRSVVAPEACDHLGHMNVQQYFAAVSDGMFALQTELGLGPSDVRQGRKLSFAVVRAESDFKAELFAGDVIRLESAIEEIGDKSAAFRHRLVRVEDGAIVFQTHFKCVLLDLETRKAASVPDDVRKKAAKFMVRGEGSVGAG